MTLPFFYTTYGFLRESGFTDNRISPSRIQRLIRIASSQINKWTGQYFNPVDGIHEWDGNEHFRIWDDKQIKIISVNSVKIDLERTNRKGRKVSDLFQILSDPHHQISFHGTFPVLGSETIQLEAGSFIVDKRSIYFTHNVWPGGNLNVLVDGVLGWLDPASIKDVSAQSTVDLVNGDVDVTVASTVGFRRRDIIAISNATESVRAIISEVDTAGNKLCFDALDLPATISFPATVQTYGAVPESIQEVTEFVARGLAESEVLRTLGKEPRPPLTRLKRERVDNYEYELFDAGDGSGGLGALTGDVFMDSILREYVAPGLVAAVV